MKWLKTYMLLAFLLLTESLICTLSTQNQRAGLAHAQESLTNRIQNQTGDVKNNTKKLMRKGKRKIRKVTGNKSLSKDIQDAKDDATGDISNGADKLKRKMK